MKVNTYAKKLACTTASVMLIGALAACGNDNSQSSSDKKEAQTLTVYSGQHKEVTDALAKDFTKETGIKVDVREGSSNELAHQVAEEGSKSPADIIFTEETAPLVMLSEQGLLEKTDSKALDHVDKQYEDPDGKWVGLLARSRVVAYNPDVVKEKQLPKSVFDFAKPEWNKKVAFVPTSGAFTNQISAMIKLYGKDKAKNWLEGLQKYGKQYKNNKMALDAVEKGEVSVALINNYYWDNEAKEKGADNMNSKLYYFGNGDIGDMISLSGAAIVKASDNKAEAQKFMEFATDVEGQQALTEASSQYPLNSKAKTKGMKPFSELNPPKDTLDLGKYSDGEQALELLQEVGLL
ncbi:extracellular solute-binding protein [Priestia megaterium]|uniref:extracellular solute-binding protein n=1 Tax=Priestia megaterium TaxID=1404 RepID=UPI000BF49728|nr:extracellular solute-binding protein [Priestia megaterium]MEB2290541.1 extracellular solute-binding protein [Priestia megaterium]MQR89183.1 extracellular solute-binding protein [Priestia megaterium]PFD97634.1 iron ABC transporter substrate-binding protein [Priestia megaterium]PFJ95557.1 iron ABC transporter substrate-binding protein [Priestia megaterium]PMD10878.1 iron ABC transporter substrate-binding protein [Priestia megaterium]